MCDYLSISYHDIIAFGDDYNDLDMLTFADQAIVVANASMAIQEVANEVCPSNDEDGVAKWIEKNLLD